MSVIVSEYWTCHAAKRQRGSRPVHIVTISTWEDPDKGPQTQIPRQALCEVTTETSAWPLRWLDAKPGDATCRRCLQLWKAAMRASGTSEEEERRAALRMITEHLAEWNEAGALDYVLPSEPPGQWRIGVIRGTSGESEPDIIALNTIEEALAFLEGVTVVAQWTVRTRKKGAW